ncbi:GNAT family N-acetyltransferase [Nocardioides sp.]|uniref:GNAT family N-acetyltransferase n=1 Tax=Nocardioides sp. TaxID=35761 RepID=UPI0027354F57|nr:GNAT family N-acetyltransferase [Nocardioides sp.]MDP3890651.1 GNAT family N-acetyltransferase [Nocardioides sp.]
MRAELTTLDLSDTSEAGTQRAAGFLEAVTRAFHEPRPKPETQRAWLEATRADRAVLRAAWLADGPFGADRLPIATYASFDKSLNAGADPVPLRMITDITVSPAHRRQGWLSTMMRADLDDAAERGVPLAALTVSEATIYGRFGFGAATFRRRIEVDTSARFRLREDQDPAQHDDGHIEMVDPAQAWPAIQETFADFHAHVRGSVDRPAFYGPLLRGELDFEFQPGNDRLRGAMHLDASGRPDGHVLFHVETDGDSRVVVVDDLVARDPRVHLALWRFLASIDLTTRVRHRGARVDDPLRWALTDAFCYQTTGASEHIWVRVLDVVAALSGRAWGADGAVVLEVTDPLGYAAGRFAVETADGAAQVAPTTAPAEVTLTVETLGSLYLGGVGVTTLRDAGRLAGDDSAIRRLAAMAHLDRAPYSVTSF